MPHRHRILPAVVLVAVLPLSAGCAGDRPGTGAESAKPTPIGRLNSTGLNIARVEFCSVIPSAAVRDALGGKARESTTWGDGDEASVTEPSDTATTGPDEDRNKDVVSEFGCSFSRGKVRASAWIYARPVDSTFARSVFARTSRREDCDAKDRPGFGSPNQNQFCTIGDRLRLRNGGLFGQTLVTCQLTGPKDSGRKELLRRTDAWCVQVVNATNTRD